MKSNGQMERRDGQNLWRQSVMGLLSLLLLTLLAANPLQALGQGTLGSSTTGAHLNTLFGSPTNSVTVSSGVTIDNSGSGYDAVSGDTHPWNLTVNGTATLNGNVNGVNLGAGGSVNNQSGGTISGGTNGVTIHGSAGSVANYGSIVGNGGDGVHLGNGGSVNNYSSIEGTINAVNISGGDGEVYNYSSITGDNNDGVFLGAGGYVENDSSGTIFGNVNGVHITGGAGSVYNVGAIYGGIVSQTTVESYGKSITDVSSAGVFMNAGGSVENYGVIRGSDYGVNITGGAGVVKNFSGIYGNSADGVYFGQGGAVFNDGTIWGNENGVYITGGAGYVTNYGAISGGVNIDASSPVKVISTVGSDGVFLGQGGTVYNDGYIVGANHGVYITGGAGSVFNHYNCEIYGDSADGVYFGQGGNVYNIGTISGYNNGVYITGGKGDVYNDSDGVIRGNNADGVYLGQGGTVFNDGTISGYNNGVEITGGKGDVLNYYESSIYGTNAAGVYLGQGGTVTNYGYIGGLVNGVEITGGPGYVYNDYESSIYGGVISMNPTPTSGKTTSSVSSDGVHMTAGGSVYNDGTIEGYNGNGVFITGGAGDVYNDYEGSITGDLHDGVYLGAGGSVENYGTISGNENGVNIAGGTGSVYNEGDIYGGLISVDSVKSSAPSAGVASYDGIHMTAAGSVDNEGSIEGYNNGVYITGGAGSVYNDGTITGDNLDGVFMNAGGSVENDWDIWGNDNGVDFTGGAGSVYNDYSIHGDSLDGVFMNAGGSVYNDWDGTIQGNEYGVEISGGAGYVTNNGEIYGNTHDGVRLRAGGTVYNDWGGYIKGATQGVKITGGPGTVINAGTIIGNDGTAILLGSYDDTVTLLTGSDTEGNIEGGGGNNTAFLGGNGYGSYSYNFLDFATLTKQDFGTWYLYGTNTFSQGVTVESGTLKINGELDTTNNVAVESGATLSGSGVIFGAVDVLSGGTLSPGSSPDTFTLYGSLNLGDNSTFTADVWSNTNSKEMVFGSATIGTNVNVFVTPNTGQIYGSNTVYTILTATNGVSGQFDRADLSVFSLFLTPSLTNDLDNVYLTLHRAKFVTVANTYNQTAVAGALDGIVDSPGAVSNLVTEFFWLPSAGAARAALDSLSGEIHGTMGMLDVQQQETFNNSIAQRTGRLSVNSGSGGFASSYKPVQLASAGSTMPPMQQAETVEPLDLWLQGFGSFGHLDGDGNAQGGDFTISGLSGGLDYRLCPQMLVGVGVGYSHNDANVGGPNANGKVDAIQFAGYGGYVNGPWHLDGILSYGFLQTDTKRFIYVDPSIQQEADGKYDGGVLSLSAEGGYAFVFDWLTVEPTIGLDYAHLWQDSFSETGIASDGHNYGLNVQNVNMDSFRSALGVRLAAQFGKKDGVQFIPAVRAVWQHEFADRYADLNAGFVGGSGDFNVRGVELGADSGILGAGLTVAFNKSVQGFVNYDADLNSQLSSHTISGGLGFSW
jgi:outer membrane autotransporter protein